MNASSSSTASSPVRREADSDRRLWIALGVGMGVSSAGAVLNMLALLTYLYERTESPLPVGAAVVLNFLPVVVFLPLITSRLGTWSLRGVTAGTAFLQAVIAGMMAITAGTQGPLIILFASSAALGLLTQVLWIAVLSALPKLLSTGKLGRGNALLQTSTQSGAVLGAFGLVIQGSAPAWTLFLLDAGTFLVQGILLMALLSRTDANRADTQPAAAAAEPTAARVRPRLREFGLVLLMPSGFIAMNVLNVAIPLIIYSRLHEGLREYAATEMAYPVVAILAGALISRYARTALIPAMLVVIAVGLVGLAFTTDIVLLIVAVGAMGGSVIGANVSTQVLAQTAIPAESLPRIQTSASIVAAVLSGVAVLALSTAFDHDASGVALVGVAVWYLMLVPVSVAVRRAFDTRAAS